MAVLDLTVQAALVEEVAAAEAGPAVADPVDPAAVASKDPDKVAPVAPVDPEVPEDLAAAVALWPVDRQVDQVDLN